MKFDAALAQGPLHDVPAIAEAAEAIGFDALWTSETQHDPFLPCALIAEHTQKVKFGTAIAVSLARSPANLAYTAWDLAAQSGGRFMLGLGTQVKAHIERRFGMPWPESPVGRLREQIQAVRAFWDSWQNGTKLNFRGEHYKLTLMTPFFDPGPLQAAAIETQGAVWVPIYIAGVNTGLARLAGELCDGFHVHPFHSLSYLKEVILPAVEDGARKAGRPRDAVAVTVTCFAASTPEEMDSARAQVAFYASTPSYRPVLDLHGWAEVGEKLSRRASRGEWSEMPMLVTDAMLHEFCVAADEAHIGQELKKRYEGVADRLMLYVPFVPAEKDPWWRTLVAQFRG